MTNHIEIDNENQYQYTKDINDYFPSASMRARPIQVENASRTHFAATERLQRFTSRSHDSRVVSL